MKIYNFDNYKNLFVIGDIHGEFKTLLYNLKTNTENVSDIVANNEFDNEFKYKRRGYTKRYRLPKFNNSILVVAGDCGFGFNKDVYYQTELVKLNDFLKECNSHLMFIRGNHDDPRFFNEEILDFSNIHCVQDYSIIKTEDFTTLCVGGGLSVDRTWRIKEEEKLNKYRGHKTKRLYWEDEMPFFDRNALVEIIKNGYKIDSIITHTSPSFTFPKTKDTSIGWIDVDQNLKKDIKKERKVMDDIFNFFNDGENIKFWAYGHFHVNHIKKQYGILFMAIDDNMTIINPINELNKINNDKKKSNEQLSFLWSDIRLDEMKFDMPRDGIRLEETHEDEIIDDDMFQL